MIIPKMFCKLWIRAKVSDMSAILQMFRRSKPQEIPPSRLAPNRSPDCLHEECEQTGQVVHRRATGSVWRYREAALQF